MRFACVYLRVYPKSLTFSSTVSSQAQQEKIDSIEANVSVAAANVEEGTRSLGKVRRERQLPLGDRSHSSPLLQPRPSNSIDPHRRARKWQLRA